MTDSAEPPSLESVPPLPAIDPPPRRSRYRPELARAQQVNKARRWLLIVAALQLVFGFAFGMKNSKDSDEAIRHLEQFEAGEKVVSSGVEYVVSDLRAQVERERIQAFAVPIGLGVAFIVLWWWAKRAALAALVSALLLFLTVHAIEAAIDPVQLARGVIVKAFFLVAMIAGIKAALAQRVTARPSA